MSLKEKAIKGFSWTAFEGLFSQGTVFIVGIVLARLLSPTDFGIIGIISVFIAVSNTIVDGGFSNALIQKVNAEKKDFHTVFYVNLAVSTAIYLLLFFGADALARYFEEPILSDVLKYSGVIIIINSFSIIQRTLLTINLNFKLQAIVSIVSSVVSGIIAIIMAYLDYGVWSLVALSILRPLIGCILLWIFNNWYPAFVFSFESFRKLFDFGYKLLVANLVNTLYKNIYYALIGKFFSPKALGYYTRADQFQAPFSTNITYGISRISYPILSSLQDDPVALKNSFRKFLKFSVLINFTIMLGIAAIAKPLVLITIGEKWHTSILYLQLLCIPGMLYPLQILNLNLLTAKGHSNLYLKLEVIKKVILLPLILVTVLFSIEVMLLGLILFSITEYFINSIYTKKLIKYSAGEQLRDIWPFFLVSGILFAAMFSVSFLKISLWLMLLIQLFIGILVFITMHEKLKKSEYLEIKEKVLSFVKTNVWK